MTLKLDPEIQIKKFGPKPGPLDEIEVLFPTLEYNTSKLKLVFTSLCIMAHQLHKVNITCSFLWKCCNDFNLGK